MSGLVRVDNRRTARQDADFAIHIRIQNGPLLRAILDAGYQNVNQFCKQCGFSPSTIGCLLNMKETPFKKNGDWLDTVKKLSELLGPLPEELFPDAVRKPLPQYRATAWAFADEIRSLMFGPQDDLESLLIKRDMVNVIRREAGLTKKENALIELRFTGDSSLEEVADVLDVTRERVRQVEKRAIRRLQNAAVSIERKDEDARIVRRYGVRYIRSEFPATQAVDEGPIPNIVRSMRVPRRHPAHALADHLSQQEVELTASRAGEQFTVAGITFTFVGTEKNSHVFCDKDGNRYRFVEIPEVVANMVAAGSAG